MATLPWSPQCRDRSAEAWLVTGGAGFIGSHAVAALLAESADVRVLDCFSDDLYPGAIKRANLKAFLAAPNFSLVEATLHDAPALRRALVGRNRILHLAGIAGVRQSLEQPAKYIYENTEGSTRLFSECRSLGIHNIVFASSSSVYGAFEGKPFAETEACDEPLSPYAASKRAAELVAAALVHGTPGLRIAGLRYFTVYGPRQRPEMAISLFARCLAADTALPLFGDGTMKRDFTFVGDAVAASLAISDYLEAQSKNTFEVFNVGSDAPVSLTETISHLEQLFGRKARIESLPKPAIDAPYTHADLGKIQRLIGWRPSTTFTEGLKQVVASMRD
jgi:UDP-glucuronate 4-epimerase